MGGGGGIYLACGFFPSEGEGGVVNLFLYRYMLSLC